jgi:hypothetical protein
MSRYIEEKDVYKLVEPNGVARVHCSQIDELPRSDVVEVVRCKDCAHYHEMKGFDYKGRKAHHCVWHSALRGENDYCSDGMRISERSENGK